MSSALAQMISRGSVTRGHVATELAGPGGHQLGGGAFAEAGRLAFSEVKCCLGEGTEDDRCFMSGIVPAIPATQ